MAYTGFITRLKNVKKLQGSDFLQTAEVFGNNVIIGLSMKENQLILYFPVDGQLEEKFAEINKLLRKDGGYLDDNKRNIKALKLRGAQSDGLVMELECLAPYTEVSKLKEGTLISEFNGVTICKKYVPNRNKREGSPQNSKKKKQKTGSEFLFFKEHIDTEQLMYNLDKFKSGDLCYLTLKMHGTSGRTSNAYFERERKQNWFERLFKMKPKLETGYEYVTGTRRTVLEKDKTEPGGYIYSGFYGDDTFRKNIEEEFAGKLHKGETVYYEIVGFTTSGSPIMGNCSNKVVDKALGDKSFTAQYGETTVFSYGCTPPNCDVYVYRITLTTEEGHTIELPWEQVKARCQELEVKHVPELDKLIYKTKKTLLAKVDKLVEGADPIGKTHIREGVVVRIERGNLMKVYKHKSFLFKTLSGIILDSANADTLSEDILSEM